MTDKADDGRHAVHYSSESDDWATPPEFFAGVSKRWGPFDLDVCASRENTKAPMWWSLEDDGLSEPWNGRVWMNPPYGRGPNGVARWVQRAAETAWSGAARIPGQPKSRSQVVALLPARTDTYWWQRWVMRAERVFLVEGRLRFLGYPPVRPPLLAPGLAVNGAPFPSALVVWGPERPVYVDGRPPSARTPVFEAMDRRGKIGPWRNVCQRCDGPYRSKRPESFYCSPKCRQAARRARPTRAGPPEPGPE